MQMTELHFVLWITLSLYLIKILFKSPLKKNLLLVLIWIVYSTVTCTNTIPLCLHWIEKKYPPQQMDQIPTADVVICLGGGLEPNSKELAGIKTGPHSLRFLTAATLVQQGKAPRVFFTTGGQPNETQPIVESQAAKNILTSLKLQNFESESFWGCENTLAEAKKMKALFIEKGYQNAILVTSASHLPRATAIFREAGLTIIPVGCNYSYPIHSFFHFPDSYHLIQAQALQNELFGWLYWKLFC